MKSIMLVLFIVVSLVFTSAPFAAGQSDTNVVVDLKDLSSDARNAVIYAIKEKEKMQKAAAPLEMLPKMDPSTAKEWVSIFTGAIRDICHDLNVEVNDFIKTPVGMLVGGLIVYKVVGKDVLSTVKRITFGVVGWLVTMTCLYLFVARKFFIRRKLKYTDTYTDKERGPVKREGYVLVPPYEFKSNDARTTAAIFMCVFAGAITIVAMITVLGA